MITVFFHSIIMSQFRIIPNFRQPVLTNLMYLGLYSVFNLHMEIMRVEYIFDLKRPHRKKSQGVRSVKRAVQETGPSLPT